MGGQKSKGWQGRAEAETKVAVKSGLEKEGRAEQISGLAAGGEKTAGSMEWFLSSIFLMCFLLLLPYLYPSYRQGR